MDYKEKLRLAKEALDSGSYDKKTIEYLFPELKESEDERIRKSLIGFLKTIASLKDGKTISNEDFDPEALLGWADWLEKQCEKKLAMIQWKGNNLKEVIDFTGKDKNFEKWFKSFEEYEKYVNDHNGIFKLFNTDGSHYEVPIGSWIVKTPDGYNVASKAIFKQKQKWSEEDEKERKRVVGLLEGWLSTFKETCYAEDCKCGIVWLKSLKEKCAWKPTDEQMEVLKEAVRLYKSTHFDSQHFKIESLYEDLKKLKGE